MGEHIDSEGDVGAGANCKVEQLTNDLAISSCKVGNGRVNTRGPAKWMIRVERKLDGVTVK